jgi:hypothetical protein
MAAEKGVLMPSRDPSVTTPRSPEQRATDTSTVTAPISSRFSLTLLEHLLRSFIDAGYKTLPFGDVDPASPQLLLRHDVDLSVPDAVRVAELEERLGVESTFFFMVRGDCYSLLDRETVAAVRRVAGMGRHIGLHIDLSLYREEEFSYGAARELDVLSWVSGVEPAAISFHRPAQQLLGADSITFEVPHTYESRYTRHIAYFSDSRGRFRFGHPQLSEVFERRAAMQLLLHPIWWSAEPEESAEERLRALVEMRHRDFERQLARNSVTFAEMQR